MVVCCTATMVNEILLEISLQKTDTHPVDCSLVVKVYQKQSYVGVKSLPGDISLIILWMVKEKLHHVTDALIKSPSLCSLSNLDKRLSLSVAVQGWEHFIMSSSFLISASHIPFVSSLAECQQCHNSHGVAVEIPAPPAGSNMYSTPKPDCRFGTLLGR